VKDLALGANCGKIWFCEFCRNLQLVSSKKQFARPQLNWGFAGI
jgi:hypothetical protein